MTTDNQSDNRTMTEKIDNLNLSEFDKNLLSTFWEIREIFDKFISENKLKIFTCPGCGYPTNSTKADYDICIICDWEDDGYDDNSKSIFDDFLDANKISGPNKISLTENRITISRTLFELAEKVNGQIIDNPKQILDILKSKREQLKKIYKSIPMTADRNHIGWKEAQNVRLELLSELISTEK